MNDHDVGDSQEDKHGEVHEISIKYLVASIKEKRKFNYEQITIN